MPWKECSVMDERLQFVARRLAGEPMAELCREFGISRKTSYKIFDRYQECGIQGLTDRSRPYRFGRGMPHAANVVMPSLFTQYSDSSEVRPNIRGGQEVRGASTSEDTHDFVRRLQE